MTTANVYKTLVKLVTLLGLSVVTVAHADDVLGYLTNKNGVYTGPSLEDNVVTMDADKNGFADVFEVRAFLELKHGKGYQKEVLDKMESAASGRSCSTPFAKDLYIK
ncbi:MAG: hypothetical protein WCG35_03210 [Betaproteobacteria bacterium]